MSHAIYAYIRQHHLALVALFVAVSGGSYAVASVGKREVGPRELKPNAVRTKHIKERQVRKKHIKNNQVLGRHVRDGTLLADDLAASALAELQAPHGPAGGDLAGTYPDPSIATGAVNSAKVANDSLTGDDVLESSLGNVPSATSADDADKVDGLDASSLIRVAGDSSEDLPELGGDALTADITAPTAGFLHIVGSVDLSHTTGGALVICFLQVDETDAAGTARLVDLDGELTDSGGDTLSGVNTEENCATNGVEAVSAGPHAVDLNLGSIGGGTLAGAGALNVLFVPFDGTGS